MVDDRRLTISSSSRLHPDEIGRRTFATARRGFDSTEVRAFLEQVAREMIAAEDREIELRELLSDAEKRAENPVLDEATLTGALGQETARVLRSAHDASADLVSRAEADSNRMLTEAQEEAGKIQASAEQTARERSTQSEAAAAEIRRRAQEESAAKVNGARLEAEALLEQARAECRAMLTEAQELRTRVLGDLTRRRRVLHSQIEQLRAGRERLAETISGVRQTVESVTDDLFRAEDEARIAAEEAGRQIAAQQEHSDSSSDVVVHTLPAPEEIGTVIPGEDEPSDTIDASSADTAEHEITGGEVAVESHEGNGSQKQQTVEELFARLRAERSPADAEGPEQAERASVQVKHRAHPPEGPLETKVDRVTATDEVEVLEDDSPAEEDSDDQDEPRHPLLTKRDESLKPIAATLARRLKRALTDDQNDILDRLRATKGWNPDLLPPESDHLARYAKAGIDQLSEAALAGTKFSGGRGGEAPGVEDFAADLATAIVIPLRRRLEGEQGAVDNSGDDAFWVEHIGAAFRDWKGTRIERLADDEAVAAFSRAALAATNAKASMQWVVDDDGIECPDCEDNSLAGPVPRGEAFPTGHPHPPAHAGCRCLLAPADA